MVKDVTKFHKLHLGGRGMLECVWNKVSDSILSFVGGGGGGWGEVGTPKFSVDVEGSGGMLPRIFFYNWFYRWSEIDSGGAPF